MTKSKKLFSIVVPFFNEESNVPKIFDEILQTREILKDHYDCEVIFMDNHSTDSSFDVANELCKKYAWVKMVRLSRNFGYQANIITGYSYAKGDAVVQLDADGEDDPALIVEMLRLWEEGYEVVYGVRKSREEGWLLQLQRKIFYRLLNFLSSLDIPKDAGDFRLLDRKVCDALMFFKEKNLYIRGLISYIGFKQIGLPYARRPRWKGESKFSWSGYFSLAMDGISAFSKKPLHVISWLGASLTSLSFLGILFYLTIYLLGYVKQSGFTTLVLLILFMSGVQLFCTGIIARYLGTIFEEVKSRPRSVVETTINIDRDSR